jgi:hypothetical protein
MIKCVPKTYGFAHVCDGCGAFGPIVGEYAKIVDLSETPLECPLASNCSARQVGWFTSEDRDLCPTCKETR